MARIKTRRKLNKKKQNKKMEEQREIAIECIEEFEELLDEKNISIPLLGVLTGQDCSPMLEQIMNIF